MENKHKLPSKKRNREPENKETKTEEIVATHYNNIKEKGIESRKNSQIIGLKNFNNWVKSVLIQKYLIKRGKVLDLCCGKGGDLLKVFLFIFFLFI
jgi:mRNA (guanine-N7-)-methyltransferase